MSSQCGSAAATDDGRDGDDNRITCANHLQIALIKSSQSTLNFYRPDALPVASRQYQLSDNAQPS